MIYNDFFFYKKIKSSMLDMHLYSIIKKVFNAENMKEKT